ncbi:hypothetical protein H257_04665 [Aphanomyces astaci]|uniref:DDE Tnp4 domain-containing protein n=1 Tax=Aphanomyces astaci TaxID=112090 RepID=W4GT23_APHAT|nr:hypothetical protein H257_04665 [Aphanomyces astaci]ETV82890.1 hypothetical protein H257_04665 [Aphanomyces astaci]|eukprot:XP_009827561.1 hypothetical protein H257_04665 [Aphanomyces astaci]
MHVINELYAQWGSLLYFNQKLVAKNIDRYCSAVASKGVPLSNVFGFIDGTKRIHCLNDQGVTAPDGIYEHFFGPVEGRRHDATMLRESGLIKYLGGCRNVFWGKAMYGDPAYGIVPYLISGFKGIDLSNEKMQFNKWMSLVRQSVEWNFKLVKTLWAYISFKMLSKIRLSPVAKVVAIAMVLTNCHCCYFRGNQISEFFNLAPPTLRQYLDTLQ